MNDFQSLGLSETTIQALEAKGFQAPTPIQAQTIPLLLSGKTDIVGQAMTGTGKTAAFGLPIVECIPEKAGHVQALVLAPTRELAIQVADEIHSLKGQRRLSVVPIYGGQAMAPQLNALRRGADVVVGTPGRVLDHLRRGTLRLDHVSFLVLDEADEMCNMGFVDDVREIFSHAGQDRRTLLFSATMPREVLSIAAEFMADYKVINVRNEADAVPLTRQIFHEVMAQDRFEALCRVIDAEPDFYGLVFCRTKAECDRLAEWLSERGYPAEPIHGDLSQPRREDILQRFRRRRATILVATDVAARGIDVPDLTHVVNFAPPQSAETYVHRTGRTGRAGKEGVAVSLIAPSEFRKLMYIARSAGLRLEKKPLPTVEDVIRVRRKNILRQFALENADTASQAYHDLAREVLAEGDPEEILAGLLQRLYGKQLDPKAYREVRSIRKPGHSGGRVRFRAAVGRAHGMTPRKFVDFVCQQAHIRPFKVQNVRISGKHSTFTVPERDGETVMRSLNRRNNGERPLVSRG
ncbi:ATP-dependent RNA helicase DeaD [Paucidesulfovibrio gracilis DSM 16080]|uniref:ATP-dependent RNA helicase DeaD n=1 Tax=Paucidesulfovibrio gracilis DSM 16080 TaxID=1121449 RepID=A0A1T4WKX3_9BACT|nr:DEAD/DEAH box helicase [Paucidesulfovibrio gracilis]SKA77839.1 ATP-dependent RNA helicase DeaD [Paucidesulfovibrio gracilis DSM 16080]